MSADAYDIAFIQVSRAAMAAAALVPVPEAIRTDDAPEAVLLRIALVAPDLGEWWRQCDGEGLADGLPLDNWRWNLVWTQRLDQCRHVLELLRAAGLVIARAAPDQGKRMLVELSAYTYALHAADQARGQATLYRELAERRGQTIREQATALLTLRTSLQRHDDTSPEFEL